MGAREELIHEIVNTLLKFSKGYNIPLTRSTLILSELDFDSLKMLEFGEILKTNYNFDVFKPPNSIEDLHSAETIADAILRCRGTNHVSE